MNKNLQNPRFSDFWTPLYLIQSCSFYFYFLSEASLWELSGIILKDHFDTLLFLFFCFLNEYYKNGSWTLEDCVFSLMWD